MQGPQVGSTERTWAMVAHLAGPVGQIVSGSQLGWLVPLVLWLVYREKNAFVAFHALQELLFQLVWLAIFWIAFLVALLLTFVLVGLLLWPVVAVVAFVPLVWAVVAALKANVGEWYEYPMVGRFARRHTLPV
ncbi:MAG: DUF4870 domain-containing protein [Armatimonadetes bacterium]|nr:DUF4870 domain-containing protein [Armatimonadota bacterium]